MGGEVTIVDAMADCVFPKDIMLCILTRLPVKSLTRFKSVCKPWRELFAIPKFIKMHYDQFSSYTRNQAFIIDDFSNVNKDIMPLLSIDSDANEPANLDLPYHVPIELMPRMFYVGCCNGIVCMGVLFDLLKVGIVLWNPTLRLSKFVEIPRADFCFIDKIALGFGYDGEDGDFRVVKIVSVNANYVGDNETGVEAGVYLAKSDTWASVELPFQFRVLGIRTDVLCNNAIVNGNPYWVSRIDEDESNAGSDVLVWFDVTRLEFKIVPLASLRLEEPAKVPIVDWKGSLAALLYTKNDERLESFGVCLE